MAILKISKTCHGNVGNTHLHETEIEIIHADPEREGGTSFSVPDLSGIKGMGNTAWRKDEAGHRVIVGPSKTNLKQ